MAFCGSPAPERDVLEALRLARGLLDASTPPVDASWEERRPVPGIGTMRDHGNEAKFPACAQLRHCRTCSRSGLAKARRSVRLAWYSFFTRRNQRICASASPTNIGGGKGAPPS